MLQLKEDTQLNNLHSNTDTKGNGAEEASTLLNGTETGAEARWAALSDADLDDEIAAFRRGIRNVSNELESLGVTVSIDEAQPEAPEGPEDAEVRWMRRCLSSRKVVACLSLCSDIYICPIINNHACAQQLKGLGVCSEMHV